MFTSTREADTIMTIDTIKSSNVAAGFHWFDKDTMRFFRTTVYPEVFEGPGGVFFVTRETNPQGITRYSLRTFQPETGDVSTAVNGFFAYSTKRQAMAAARKEMNCL